MDVSLNLSILQVMLPSLTRLDLSYNAITKLDNLSVSECVAMSSLQGSSSIAMSSLQEEF